MCFRFCLLYTSCLVGPFFSFGLFGGLHVLRDKTSWRIDMSSHFKIFWQRTDSDIVLFLYLLDCVFGHSTYYRDSHLLSQYYSMLSVFLVAYLTGSFYVDAGAGNDGATVSGTGCAIYCILVCL